MNTQAIDWVTPVLTAALVIITIYYAWQTQRMVREMRRARELSVAPKLTISFRVLFPRFGVVTVQNVGLGPATTVDIHVTFEPGKNSARPMEKRHFRTNVMMPGEEHRFYPPFNEQESIMDAGEVAQHYSRFILDATFRDPLGKRHVAHESMEDYPEFWEMAKASGHTLQTIPEEVTAQELEKIRKVLEKLPREGERIIQRRTAQRRMKRELYWYRLKSWTDSRRARVLRLARRNHS